MLKHKLIHPQINEILGSAGHHARILIADGNYPASSKMGPEAELVSLNLMPGVVTCNQVLEAILSAVPVEEINTMMYETEGPYALSEDPPVWDDYRQTIKNEGLDLQLEGNREMVVLRCRCYGRPRIDDPNRRSAALCEYLTLDRRPNGLGKVTNGNND